MPLKAFKKGSKEPFRWTQQAFKHAAVRCGCPCGPLLALDVPFLGSLKTSKSLSRASLSLQGL